MHTRVVTFTGAKDIDAGIRLLSEQVIPVLNTQRGYRGVTASANRAGGDFAVLSLWETPADLDASEGALARSRQEASKVIGGDLKVETFEQLVAEVGQSPPAPGSALMVTRFSMDPARINDNIAFFRSNIVPRIRALAGFQGLRNMINRATGEGIVGTVWSDQEALKRAADDAQARREEAVARGVKFGDVTFREIVLVDLR